MVDSDIQETYLDLPLSDDQVDSLIHLFTLLGTLQDSSKFYILEIFMVKLRNICGKLKIITSTSRKKCDSLYSEFSCSPNSVCILFSLNVLNLCHSFQILCRNRVQHLKVFDHVTHEFWMLFAKLNMYK